MNDNDEICEERMRSLRFSPDPNAVWAHAEITRLSNALTQTQRERDEARRKVCEGIAHEQIILGLDNERATAYATNRGWDCYDHIGDTNTMVYTPTTLDKLAEAADTAYTAYIAASKTDEVAVNAAAPPTAAKVAAFANYIASKTAYLDARKETV